MSRSHRKSWLSSAIPMLLGGLVASALFMSACVAPTERSMGDSQRIVYVHVAVAWLGLLGFMVMAGAAVRYLMKRDLAWDHWFQAAGELGWLGATLTLLTGSLWAHEAWGTWWEWDPRLTASFVLWLIYTGIFVLRGSLDDAHQRARVSAVLGILGAADVPLVIIATRWFRGLHPATPEMEPVMRWTLLVNVVAFSALFTWLAFRRRAQLQLKEQFEELERLTMAGERPAELLPLSSSCIASET